MKFEEVLPALRAGKKIRRIKQWKGCFCFYDYIWLENNDLWFIDKGECYMFYVQTNDILADDWEIVDD